MKILSVVGARPNFMKAAPIIAAVNRHNKKAVVSKNNGHTETIEHILLHTGQHYDEVMSGSFFSDLDLPPPDIHLGVGSGSPTFQTAEIMTKFEAVLWERKPDVVVVVGDVTSTLSCALVTAKISFDSAGSRPLIAHVEAGLRSFDRSMPEEVNRLLTDHVSDLLFVTEASGLQNLRNEGISPERVYFVGNTMIDSLLAFKQRAESSSILKELGLRRPGSNNGASICHYSLLTLHRPANVDNRETFLNILGGLEELASECPIIFPIHPRTQKRLEEFDLLNRSGAKAVVPCAIGIPDTRRNGIVITKPMGYLDFLCLMMHASLVVTDSGGIQEETTCLGVPCVTVRENTERPITLQVGTNVLAGTDKENIKNAIRRQRTGKISASVPEKWDGRAATRIVEILAQTVCDKVLSELIVSAQGVRQLMPMGTFD